MKAFNVKRSTQPFRFNLNKLNQSDICDQYVTETNNRFAALLEVDTAEMEPNALWSNIAGTLKDVATDILGRAPRRKVTDSWIGDETLKLIQERREARYLSDNVLIRKLNKKIKKSLRKDKKTWLERQCAEIDEFDRMHKGKALYRKISALIQTTSSRNQNVVNNSTGLTLTEPNQVLKRWEEYGRQLFGSNSPIFHEEQVTTPPAERNLSHCFRKSRMR